MNLYYETGDELMHYGRKGMKWYQHIYGAAKTVGRGVRRGATAASVAAGKVASSYKAKRKQKQEAEARKHPKSVKDMSDEELRNATSRLQAEQNYLNLQKNISNMSPKQVSAGKKFLETAASQVINPVVVNIGKKWLEGKLNDKLGIDTKSELQKLKEATEKAELTKRKTVAEDFLSKRETKKQEEAAAVEEAAKTKADAQKKVDAYNNNSGAYSKKGSDIIDNVFGKKKSAEIMSMSTTSKEVASSAAKGEKCVEDIFDRYGNVIISDYKSAA